MVGCMVHSFSSSTSPEFRSWYQLKSAQSNRPFCIKYQHSLPIELTEVKQFKLLLMLESVAYTCSLSLYYAKNELSFSYRPSKYRNMFSKETRFSNLIIEYYRSSRAGYTRLDNESG